MFDLSRMKALPALALAASLALSMGACGSSSESASSTNEPGDSQPSVSEQHAQVFDADVATAEYKDTQDIAGNAMVTFSLENKSDKTVMVGSDNLVVNGQYSIESLGGSPVNIAPSTTGSVSLTFGVSTQTELSGTYDMETLSGELVLYDADGYDEIGRVPFDITI